MLKKLKGEGVVNGFFQDLETVEFPAEKLKALYPQLVGEWEVIAKLESVPWPWVCLLELSLAGFLAPTACLYLFSSIPDPRKRLVFFVYTKMFWMRLSGR